jgi:pSer/pThr/pTyr-binding forkhead associated (FHA) protein
MDRRDSEKPVITAQAGLLNGERWSLSQSMIIGRDAACEIIIPDRQVSRFHARIRPDGEGAILEDLASKNGTYVNGKLVIEPVFLNDGDLLQVALVQGFVFLSSDATLPMEKVKPTPISTGEGIFVDNRSRRIWVNKKEIVPPLSVPQYRLLKALYEQVGKVVSRQELISAVWEEEEASGVSEQALDALVRRLRTRLQEIDQKHDYIVTVRGYGLRLENSK